MLTARMVARMMNKRVAEAQDMARLLLPPDEQQSVDARGGTMLRCLERGQALGEAR